MKMDCMASENNNCHAFIPRSLVTHHLHCSRWDPSPALLKVGPITCTAQDGTHHLHCSRWNPSPALLKMGPITCTAQDGTHHLHCSRWDPSPAPHKMGPITCTAQYGTHRLHRTRWDPSPALLKVGPIACTAQEISILSVGYIYNYCHLFATSHYIKVVALNTNQTKWARIA